MVSQLYQKLEVVGPNSSCTKHFCEGSAHWHSHAWQTLIVKVEAGCCNSLSPSAEVMYRAVVKEPGGLVVGGKMLLTERWGGKGVRKGRGGGRAWGKGWIGYERRGDIP